MKWKSWFHRTNSISQVRRGLTSHIISQTLPLLLYSSFVVFLSTISSLEPGALQFWNFQKNFITSTENANSIFNLHSFHPEKGEELWYLIPKPPVDFPCSDFEILDIYKNFQRKSVLLLEFLLSRVLKDGRCHEQPLFAHFPYHRDHHHQLLSS